ncbi:MAG: phenylalanine--tRNA ligase subunit alpha [Candidatus Aenigmatarchaeota archaeon]|nr:MAG: phenylalanine--tRNA ligase subunit alpha [Candidatus Aenigmarchaeota archaeon]
MSKPAGFVHPGREICRNVWNDWKSHPSHKRCLIMEDLIAKLHPHEKKILLVLSKLNIATPLDISKESGLSLDAVNKAGQWASIKGLLKIEKERKRRVELTEEGQRYVEEGLPEKRLLLMVKDGKKHVNEIRKQIANANIAIAWAKRKGWIKIENGVIEITEKGIKACKQIGEDEKALRDRKGSERVLKELEHRNLVKIIEGGRSLFMLTDSGKNIVKNISVSEEEEIGQITPDIIKSGAWKKKKLREYDILMPAPKIYVAKLHPYIQFLNNVRMKLISLGFKEVSGPFVELEFWNCDALFMPQDHPARSIHDMLRVKRPARGAVKDKNLLERVRLTHENGWITGSSGWGYFDVNKSIELVMRSQTTAVSARTLSKLKGGPAKFFTIDRVFRPDIVDANHLFEFHQAEGIVIGKNLTFRHLLGFLEVFGKEIAGAEKIRFRPGYFPFTEPSVEMDCMVNGKWLEVAGAGIFRPEVVMPLGIKERVLAWGIGITRFAMIKLKISDLRTLFTKDIDYLRDASMVI